MLLDMEALSQDLRDRVVAAWDHGEGSQTELARRFRISESAVYRIIKRWEETGSTAPKARGGDTRSKIVGDDREALKQMHAEEPDATLERFQARFRDERGIKCSLMTFCRELKKLGLTVKKNAECERATAAGRP